MVVPHDDVTICGIFIDVAPHAIVLIVVLCLGDDHGAT